MTTDDPVRRALKDLADADAFRHAPPHLERAILHAFDRHSRPGWFQRCAATVWASRREAMAVAVAVVLGIATTFYVRVLDRSRDQPRETEPVEAQQPRLMPAPATRQAPPRPWTQDDRPVASAVTQGVATWGTAEEGTHSVRVRVPRSYLPLLGVPIIDPDADGMINLEVRVAEDGLVRTIHVVR